MIFLDKMQLLTSLSEHSVYTNYMSKMIDNSK